MAETRAEDDRHVRPYGNNFLGKFDTCHLGHRLVGDDQIESGRVEPEEGKGFCQVRSESLAPSRRVPPRRQG